jgi:hypothetical protein
VSEASDPHAHDPGDGCRPCPGPCNRRWRGDADPTDRHWHAAPEWCAACECRIRRDLHDLTDLAAFLTALPIAPSRSDGDRRRSGELSAAPSPWPTGDLADEIIRTVCAWADALAEHLRWRRDPFTDLTTAVRYLSVRLTPALSGPFARDLGREVSSLARQARWLGKVDWQRREMRDCARCHRRTVAIRDDETVECLERLGGCGWLNTYDRYLALVRQVNKHRTGRTA